MSDKDFAVTADTILQVLAANEIAREQSPLEHHAIYGCAAIEHDAEDRVDLLTLDLAYRIATTTPALEEALSIDPVATVRQIVADLEPKTRHWPTRTITFWENVEVACRPADLTKAYVPDGEVTRA